MSRRLAHFLYVTFQFLLKFCTLISSLFINLFLSIFDRRLLPQLHEGVITPVIGGEMNVG